MKFSVLCYIRDGQRTLMIHRINRPEDMHYGKWNAPGGKFEQGETPEECCLREVFEETGLTLKSVNLRGILTFPAFDGEEDWYVFVFTSKDFQGILRKSCPEGELHWIDDRELTNLALWEGDRIFMRWLDDKGFFSGKFIYDSSGYVSHSVTFYDGDKQ